jgi:hypothetical protein
VIFTSPFFRILAVLISARWMVLCFTSKQVNTSYSSEQMCIFCEKEGKKKVKVKGSWTTEGTVRFAYDGGVTPKNCTGKT